MRFATGLATCIALLAAPAQAQTLAVEGVVSPAWVERAGSAGREPLSVGMTLNTSDRVHTGNGSRALLRLADGSAVKLGEDAVLAIDQIGEQQNQGARKLVNASLDVVRGAFRFTTGIFSKRRADRDVRIRVATVTAGIRGTDLWGKSDAQRDLVCLIEGRISVNHAQTGEFTMSDPLAFFVAPRNEKTVLSKVDGAQLKQWATETELDAVGGGARRGGRFRADVGSYAAQPDALRAYDTLRNAGFPAAIRPVKREGGVEYHVRIANLPTQAHAQAMVEKVKALGLAQASIGK